MTSVGPLIPILCYHSISDEPRDGALRWSVSPGLFDEQMSLLRDRGHTTLTVRAYSEALRGGLPMPPRPVLITFDDGFADLATTALPILQRYGLTATAYVITGRIGTRPERGGDPMLDWDQVAALRDAGIDVGSHSHTHRELDTLSRAEVRREVGYSKLLLEDKLAAPVSSFAYPYGYHSAAVVRQVRDARYECACAVKNALSHKRDDTFALARVLMHRDMGVKTLEALLDGHGAPPAWRGERPTTRVWRLVRRGRRLVARTGRQRIAPWPRDPMPSSTADRGTP